MNLVQINERLKDLPMQVLQQYANGMNPEVPPYLALGELQRREMTQKQMATAQGAQGPQSSVKEQVEQKAGLMALQQMQQQQAMQQMQQPRGPMPAPAGVPQPEAQPEAMMARGGLASVPVRRDMFEYAGGGIIAFAGGGSTEEKYRRESEEMGEGKRTKFSPDVQSYANQLRAAANAEQEGFAERERQRMLEKSREIAPERPAVMAGPNVTEEVMKRVGPMTAPKFADPRMAQAKEEETTGLPAALPKALPDAPARPSPMAATPAPNVGPFNPAGPRPAGISAGAQAGLPAALAGTPTAISIPVSPDRAELDAMMASQKREAPTAKGVIEGVNALLPEGMQDEATKKLFGEQRARAEAAKAAYEKSQPTGLQNLIRVLGQAGQYKGFSGVGPAYTALQQQRRAEDLDFQKQQDELMTAIEGRERGADEKLFGARSTAMDRAQQSFSESEKSILSAAAKKLEADQGRLDKQTQLNMQNDLARFEALVKQSEGDKDRANRLQTTGMQVANQNIIEKMGVEYVSILAKARAERQKNTPQSIANANELDARAKSMEPLISKVGGAGNAGVGAGRNAIMERRQTMQELQQIIKDEGMVYTDAQKADAARQYQRLAMQNVSEGDGGAPKVMSQADVLATAKSSGKTPQQVIEAAKARGYTIQ